MAKSIMQMDWDTCYLCGRNHVFGGANRKFSEKYGLKIHICGERCHRNGKDAVHKNKTVDMAIKAAGQKIFESECGSHDDFMRIFGKNYI